jgi:glycosyltransferase involved in cell wall biosynthesis
MPESSSKSAAAAPGSEAREALLDIAVLIPAFNEEESLPLVLRDLPDDLVRRVLVVNNASTDTTPTVAEENGALVIEEKRRGYGSACLAGIEYYRQNDPPDILVFLDADYSDYPDDLPDVVGPILNGEADLVIGSRMRGEREPGALLPQAYFGNKLACTLIRLFWGYSYSDLGPFRAIRWETLEALGMVDTNFGWTVEMQIKALRHGARVTEVPVRYRKRIGVSKITGTLSGTFRAGYKILYTIWKYRR